MRNIPYSLGFAAALTILIACGSGESSTQNEVHEGRPPAAEVAVQYDRSNLLADLDGTSVKGCDNKTYCHLDISLPNLPAGFENPILVEVFTYDWRGQKGMGVNFGGDSHYSFDLDDVGADGWGPEDKFRDSMPFGPDEHTYHFDNPEDREKGKELYDLVMNAIYKARASGVEFE